MFPSNPDSNFWDVISGHCDSNEWVFISTLVIAIPSSLMFILSVFKKVRATKVIGWIGLIGIILIIVDFVNQFEVSELFDFDDGNLCFGFWIAFILYIVIIFIPTKNKKDSAM